MVEEFKLISCIICLNVESDENCRVIDESVKSALNALLLKLPIEETINSMPIKICNACCTKVLEAFRFKVTCTDTEDSILPYINLKNGALVDLKEVYIKERGKEQLRSVLEDEGICRLCMQIVTSGFISTREIEIDLISLYIPEVNFNVTEAPIVCAGCLECLKTHGDFLRNCLGVQQFENVLEDIVPVGQFDIKMEEIEIKSEKSTNDIVTPLLVDEPPDSEPKGSQTQLFKAPKYECSNCGFQTDQKSHFMSHQLKHKKLSEVVAYQCDHCKYKTKYKQNLASHKLIHKDISEVQMYKCKTCNFESRHRVSLLNHELLHKDISEVKMYKCDKCNYKTRQKRGLTAHTLIHKDISQVQMYKCEMCSYEAKRKASLVRHMVKHKDISK